MLRVVRSDPGRKRDGNRVHAVNCSIRQSHAKAPDVQALAGMLARLDLAMGVADTESDLDRLANEAEAVIACLARVRAVGIGEVRIKLDVLRARLEESLDPEAPSEATTLALVAGIVSDLALLDPLAA